ncbi:hypothetical protein X975_20515, partial [Stegodyphus mimosarum]
AYNKQSLLLHRFRFIPCDASYFSILCAFWDHRETFRKRRQPAAG